MSDNSNLKKSESQVTAVAALQLQESDNAAITASSATGSTAHVNRRVARFRTQWAHGDWDSLAAVTLESLSDDSADGLVALYAAAGHLQRGSVADARDLVELALKNGIGGHDVLRVLVSGVYTSLAKAARAGGLSAERSEKLLSTALSVGAPDDDVPLLFNSRDAYDMASLPGAKGPNQPDGAPTLVELYSHHEGLVSDKWDRYLHEYERIFSAVRSQSISLLEIGVQNGGSLEIWDRYFPNAEMIVGCDIDPKCGKLHYESPRIAVVIGDVKAEETRESILSHSNSFDIIIDDGSHTSNDIIVAFCRLFPYLEQGGIYLAEDLHCSYWKQYGGGLLDVPSSVQFFKSLADVINHEHWGCSGTRAEYLLELGFSCDLPEHILWEVHSIEFVNSLCVIKRKSLTENELGRRRIAGSREAKPAHRKLDGTRMSAPRE